MIRIAVVGAGLMARIRAKALVETGRAQIVAVAGRSVCRIQALCMELQAEPVWDGYDGLLRYKPDAVLVETPHAVQDTATFWALTHRLPVLVGGPLACSVAAGERIADEAERRHIPVEAGFQARYMPLWEDARRALHERRLGQLVLVRSLALWNGDPHSWYYSQSLSGGMPLTHMSYCFINPLRWLLGEPYSIHAVAGRCAHTAPEHVQEETVAATLCWPGGIPCSLCAGYVKPAVMNAWYVELIGTDAALELQPVDFEPGYAVERRGAVQTRIDYPADATGFAAQAHAFLDAVEGRPEGLRNRPEAALGDLRVAEAIVRSAAVSRS